MIITYQKLLIIIFFLCLLVTVIPFHRNLSAADETRWVPVKIPTEGATSKWTLANGSDIRHLTMANDGTLYCYVTPVGMDYTLFKSTDGGRSWTTTGKVTDVIIDIITHPQDSNTIYYATSSCVYRSTDSGNIFISLPPNPGGAGSNNISITAIDVVDIGNGNTVVVSTTDIDSTQYGGVYLLEESHGFSWINTNIGNYDVYRVAFSPDYTNDRQLIAIISDEVFTYAASRIYTGNWGQLIGNARIADVVPSVVNVAFPDDYNGIDINASFFVGIDTGINAGDIFKITGALRPTLSIVEDLNIGSVDWTDEVDIASLAISGETILAGCARDACVYLSNDSGVSWTRCLKPPTGQTDTSILIVPDFTSQHKAYAITCGIESAFSYSTDNGATWNQISLIDTKINDIPDFATPLSTMTFILTFNSSNLKHSLWRTTDSGINWDRIFCSSFTSIDNLKLVKTIPQYSADSPILFVAGQKDNSQFVWKSSDNGQVFIPSIIPYTFDTWSIVDSTTWFIGTYNGSEGLVYQTTNGGSFYTSATEAGNQPLTAVLASPDYLNDGIVLAGNTAGEVYLSEDNGKNFNLIGEQLPLNSGIGRINLAFDSKFSDNRIIYATTDAKVTAIDKERIFRFTIGKSTNWQSVCSSLPDGAIIKHIVVADSGMLYAVNTQSVVVADAKGGVLRSLNPTCSSPTFETTLSELQDTVVLNNLSVCGNQVWTIDTRNTRLMTFIDSLSLPVTLISPDDRASGLDTTSLNLKWQTSGGATEYEWQVSDNNSFTGISSGLTGKTESSTVRSVAVEPAATYYWRVRTCKPYLSPWSEVRSFTTVLGGSNIAPILLVPEAGSRTTTKPIFQWSTIVSAVKYDLLVAKDAIFNDIVIDKTGSNALPGNAWESDIVLDNDTAYYWKVKARSDNSYSEWSAVSAFITEALPLETVSAETITTTILVTQQIEKELPATQQTVSVNVPIPSWIMYGGIALLGGIVITLVVIVIVMIRRRN